MNFDVPRSASQALSPAETLATPLGRRMADLPPSRPGESGFRLLHDGRESFALRLDLIRRAERSIDAQYYLITADNTGLMLGKALLDAADRGVRVRLLIDDIQTRGADSTLLALDAHPQIEVRIFNPFDARGSRWLDSATHFRRLNRRMHNKSATFDNQITIVGGRNIADEYFGVNIHANFSDFDLLAVGPITSEVSANFDRYWNYRFAVPVVNVAKTQGDAVALLQAFRLRVGEHAALFNESPYMHSVDEMLARLYESSLSELIWAAYDFRSDAPEKFAQRPQESTSIFTSIAESMGSAASEIAIISPYFVPLQSGVDRLRAVRQRGVNVSIYTNSLASENHAIVHGGYAPFRKPMLAMGVRLFETRPDAIVPGAELLGSTAAFNLHTKAYAIDRRELFIGSFNFDPRSVHLNTEMGIVVKSETLAGEFTDYTTTLLASNSYELFLDDRQRIRWREQSADGNPRVYTSDPHSTTWQRAKVRLLALAPIDQEL